MKTKLPQQRLGDDYAEAESLNVWAQIQRVQAGDAAAFGLLYERYYDMVFRFAYSRTGTRTAAEDFTAEAFTRALQKIDMFTWQGRDFGAWLVTIARNAIADHFKSMRYRSEMSVADYMEVDRPHDCRLDDPETAALDRVTNLDLMAAVSKLPSDQRECVYLRVLRQYSVKETAAVMGKEEGAIKALFYRAMDALARLIGDGVDDRGAPVRFRAKKKVAA